METQTCKPPPPRIVAFLGGDEANCSFLTARETGKLWLDRRLDPDDLCDCGRYFPAARRRSRTANCARENIEEIGSVSDVIIDDLPASV